MKILKNKFYCTCCGKETITVQRKTGQERDKGHLKKLWCVHCMKEHNCVEVKEFGKYTKEMFDAEYTGNNFDEYGNRKIPSWQFFNERGTV